MARAPVSERTQVFRSASLIGLLTLFSRFLGMARDIFSASVFGVTMVWDAFVIAWTVPNLFRRLFGEGALSSTFIPVYAGALEEGPSARPKKVLRDTLGALLLLLGAIVALGVAFCLVLPSLAGGLGGEKLGLATRLTALLLPYLLLICVTALYSAVLNVHRRFAAAAFGPALLNVFWLGGLGVAVFAYPGQPLRQIVVVGVALLAGGFAQVVLLIPQLIRFTGFPRPTLGISNPDVRRIGSLAAPVLFGLAILQVNVLLDRFIAEFCVPQDGAVSALWYGNRLIQFPLGTIAVAVSTAAFPLLSRLAARDEIGRMKRVLVGALKGTFFLSLPAAVGLIILAEPVVDLLFGHGAFAKDADAVRRTAWVVIFYSLGIPAYSLLFTTTRAFYALQDTVTPTRVAMGALGINLALNLTLVWVFEEGGLALATAISAALQLVVLFVLLRRRIGFQPILDLLLPGMKTVLSTAVMSGACLVVWQTLPILGGEGVSARFAKLAVVIGLGAMVFFLASVLLRDANLAVLRRRGKPALDMEENE
ncbi:MAG: murein biosynthesis integral membrane protein MurJ [Planctomycetota bacterium]|jgi:putative peptidoglycan lipid II flippase